MTRVSEMHSETLKKALAVGLSKIECSPFSEAVYGWLGSQRYRVANHFVGYKTHGYWRTNAPQCLAVDCGDVALRRVIDLLVERHKAKRLAASPRIQRIRRR